MKNIMRLTYFSLLLATLFASCVKKDDMYKETTDESARKQVLKLMGAPDLVAYARDVKPTLDTFVLIDLRRYPNTEGELNQPLTVKLQSDPSFIDTFNNNNATSFIELPSASYTLLDDLNNLTFQGGEAIREVRIVVDQSQLDLSQQYALAFMVTDPGGAVINGGATEVIYNVGVKNKYDGSYGADITLAGWGAYGIADGVTYTWSTPIDLITSGAASVTLSTGYQPGFDASGGETVFGATYPQYTFDPATDQMIEVINLAPDDGRGRGFHLDATQTSYYDPATKNVYAHYIMVQNGRPDQHIDITFTYKGPR
ncbi:MAG TPA: DUF1735 domain-containing protein [Chitinophagaceae bacterium]|jgi:uncharacterized protein DUF1735|nr:DUF1735 domain-containing protein [Chitinophagaceae bacterium]